MFGVGWQELLVIFLVLLIFVGPKKLPELARSIGKALRDFARAKEEVRRTIEREFSVYSGGEEENGTGKNYLEINLREPYEDEDNKKEDEKGEKNFDGEVQNEKSEEENQK